MKVVKRVTVLATLLAFLVLPATASAEFSIAEFSASTTSSQAGAHPDVTTSVVFSTIAGEGGTVFADGNVRTLKVQLPPGLQGAPSAVPRCSQVEFSERECGPETQVGWVEIAVSNPAGVPSVIDLPAFNLRPRNEQIDAEIAFSAGDLGTAHLLIEPRSNSDYGLTVIAPGISRFFFVTAFELTIWGVPGDPSHDSQRLDMTTHEPLPPRPLPSIPFLANPTTCGSELTLHAEATFYQDLDRVVEADAKLPPITGCSEVPFAPRLHARPTTDVADSPSGLDLDLAIPQNLDPAGLVSAQLRNATVTLPEGLVVNPATANGLETCAPAQIGLVSALGDPIPHFGLQPPSCLPASSLGTVEVLTPLLGEPLKGTVYLATPHRNPFGSLLAIYLSIQGHGLDLKLPGRIEPDPETGRITIKLEENPQLSLEHLKLHLFNGAAALLRTPAVCGTYATTSSLTPWSAPESGPPATPTDPYAIARAPGGGACAGSETALPNAPAFEAGSGGPIAGSFQPVVVNLSREDGTQQFGALTVTPPPGLLAKLTGTDTCPDLALALAADRSGKAEQASPSCPLDSKVGRVFVDAGAGPRPYTVSGTAYLAGPYRGAPFSLAIVTPAVAGPFDLGTVVVRAALYFDPETAQVTAKSDPIPSILEGIPLDVRSVSLRLDKREFTLNPSSCEPNSIDGLLSTNSSDTASLTSDFQVGECGRLGFKPRLALKLLGGFARNAHPALRAVLRAGRQESNLAAATITLPPGELLDLRNVDALCASSFPPERCPPGSRLGKASVWSPLLDAPMRGPIYLRQPAKRYPDLLADLRGPNGLRFFLRGGFDATEGRVGVRFSKMPDLPLEKAVLTVAGGRRGILVNSRALCAPRRSLATFVSQDNRRREGRPKLTLKGRC
jgi:hypothetical protein